MVEQDSEKHAELARNAGVNTHMVEEDGERHATGVGWMACNTNLKSRTGSLLTLHNMEFGVLDCCCDPWVGKCGAEEGNIMPLMTCNGFMNNQRYWLFALCLLLSLTVEAALLFFPLSLLGIFALFHCFKCYRRQAFEGRRGKVDQGSKGSQESGVTVSAKVNADFVLSLQVAWAKLTD